MRSQMRRVSLLCSRWTAALAAAALLSLGVTACDKRKLTEVEVPDQGVELTYGLAPGDAYEGHVRVANSIASPAGEIYNALEFDVTLQVTQAQGDRFQLEAVVNKLQTDVRLPQGVPKQMGLSQQAAESANGMQFSFFVNATGEVTEMPKPPQDADPQTQGIVSLLSTGLRAAFVRLPPAPVKPGDSWDTAPTEPTPGSNATGSGKLDALAQDASTGGNVAKLQYQSSVEASSEAEGASLQGSLRGTAKALFSPSGYVVDLERQLSGEAGGMTLSITIEAGFKPTT